MDMVEIELSVMNQLRARFAVLYFEEEPEVQMGLGLGGMIPTGTIVPGIES